jgi:hypothetical protein
VRLLVCCRCLVVLNNVDAVFFLTCNQCAGMIFSEAGCALPSSLTSPHRNRCKVSFRKGLLRITRNRELPHEIMDGLCKNTR